MAFLFDTYAFIAYYIEKNKAYKPYFTHIKETDCTTILSVMELYHRVYHTEGEEKAEETLQNITSNFKVYVPLDIRLVKDAGKLKSEMMKGKKKPSYTDCVNYVLSQSMKLKFLTGDKAFKNVKGVEFVK